jgi:NAD(P)-dependent dehydrogenase (short-subunit alcohol dehydrogenase family)
MKTAMIWGASGGIGRALVDRLQQAEWRVFALSRHLPAEQTLIGEGWWIEADPADDFSVQQGVMRVGQETSAVDLWIYAAGDIATAKSREMSPDTWQRILNANLTGAYMTTHRSLPLLSPEAHLFYLGAYSEKLRLPGLAAYAASKAGLEAFTDALAKEERKRKITNVRPAAVETPLWEKASLRLPKGAMQPDDLAEKLLHAYQEGHQGPLDL